MQSSESAIFYSLKCRLYVDIVQYLSKCTVLLSTTSQQVKLCNRGTLLACTDLFLAFVAQLGTRNTKR